MTDPATVGRALGALADPASAGATSDRPSHRRVVETARTAFSTLDDAASFLEDDGEPRLRRAVTAAARAGDHDCARAGRALLCDLDRLRAALGDGADRADGGDHFHSGRTTVLGGGGQRPDR